MALVASPPARGDDAAGQRRVGFLLDNGARDLAGRLLEELQPEAEGRPGWLGWERLRHELYRQRGDWQQLSRRLMELSPELPLFERQQLITHSVELMLESDRGDLIRRHLRELLWRGAGDSKQISYWRRLMVRGYLAEDSMADARIAIERYQTEYLPADSDWSYLYAKVLLRLGDARGAAAVLATVQNSRARALLALSRLRAAIDEPQQTLASVREMDAELDANDPLHRELLSLEAEAALDAGDFLTRAVALERLFQLRGPAPPDSLFALTIDDLWLAYRDVALGLGNERNLLLGESEPWFELAAELEADGQGLAARSIYALHTWSPDTPIESEAPAKLYDSLRAARREQAAMSLFTASRRFSGQVTQLPVGIRHRVARYAMGTRDMELGARMIQDLETAAPGQDPLDWTLIRARLAIYTGAAEYGERLLHEAITPLAQIEADVADRIMQLLFDLQNADRNAAAFELFAKMHERVTATDRKREILFWMAQAKAGQGGHEQAALLYIQSAMEEAGGADIWGHTARVRAAESLAEAGLIDDARRVYEGLLAATADRKQVMSLERRLQQLWLRQPRLTPKPGSPLPDS